MFKNKPVLQDKMSRENMDFYDAAGSSTSAASHSSPSSSSASEGRIQDFDMRKGEREYAFLKEPTTTGKNRYGREIDLIARSGGELPAGREMRINDKDGIGSNPNRNLQYGFHFTADNCIGCHSCEAACSEKNDNPAHIAFRSVGYVEGGTYPDYKRMNISMACNHCDDPVCLKGCPTGAYTKHAEFGAVLQDPDTCFGCGYCTWVCPYNAPQLDPVKGQVSKCNMCVDRLEVGLKPSCVTACLGNALDFGVIENTPENRQQIKTAIPGFPDPEITHPNIRFQQTKTLPDEMTRTDSALLKYHKTPEGNYQPVVDQKKGQATFWNIPRLSSRENPLVMFTLLSQMAIGAFMMMFIGTLLGMEGFSLFSASSFYPPLALLCVFLVGFGLFMSTTHLGKPLRFYRGFNNWRHSPVCREGLGIAAFMACVGLHAILLLPTNSFIQQLVGLPADFPFFITNTMATALGCLAIPAGAVGVYYMNRCYRIPARPFWNHWQVASSFLGTMLSLGGLLILASVVGYLATNGDDYLPLLTTLGAIITLGILIEGLGLIVHARDMNRANNEGGASHYVQCTTFGKTYWLRNTLMVCNVLLALGLTTATAQGLVGINAWFAVALLAIISSIISRCLFYVLVIPTTMPGAFFWKNKSFEEHAKAIGLAKMSQVGIVDTH